MKVAFTNTGTLLKKIIKVINLNLMWIDDIQDVDEPCVLSVVSSNDNVIARYKR